MTKGLRSVLFDFGGTLDADGTTWLDRFYPIYKEAGIDAGKEPFSRAFYKSDDTLPGRYALKGLSFQKTLELQVDQVLAELAPSLRSRGPTIAGRFLSDCRKHFERNRPVLERLAKRYQLGIVSNFYGNLESVLASEGLRALFGTVADSGAIGVSKPEPAIFLRALSALGGDAAACVMVGDSVPRDMRGAEGLNMAHAFLNPLGAPPCCPKSWTLKALPDLEPLLG